MSRDPHGPSPARCLAVWSLVTTAAAATPIAVLRDLATAGAVTLDGPAGLPFDRLLTAGCAVALVACAAWFWAVTTLTVALALRGHHGRVPGCPDGVRRLVLAACGLAVLAAAAPANADQPAGSPPTPDPPHVLAGLPYPDRPSVGPAPPTPAPVSRPGDDASTVRVRPGDDAPTVRVRPGDTLWAIARRQLPHDAPSTLVDERWREIWRANCSIGPDPDLILPGSTLHLPSAKES